MELHIYPLSIEGLTRIGVVNKQFNTDFPNRMKQIAGSLWTAEHKCWHIPYTKETWHVFEQLFEGHTIIRDLKQSANAKNTEGETNQPVSTLHEANNVQKEPSRIELKEQVLETLTSAETLPGTANMPTENRIIAQRCPDKPDRIFLTIPTHRIDWKTYAHQVKDSQYHAAERLWSVPRTKELYKQFVDYFGDNLVVDKEKPVILTENKAPTLPPLPPRFTDKLTIFESNGDSQKWSIHLPKLLMPDYLSIVKNIVGRQWDNSAYVWRVPKTKDTLRFIKTYLQEVMYWAIEVEEALLVDNLMEVEKPQYMAQSAKVVQESAMELKQLPMRKVLPAIPQSSLPYDPYKINVRMAEFWRGYLRIDFPFIKNWVEKIKKIEGARWHAQYKCWTVAHSTYTLDQLNKHFTPTELNLDPLLPLTPINPIAQMIEKPKFVVAETPQYAEEIVKLEEQMILKRMSITTTKTYKNCFSQFLFYYNTLHPKDISKEQITAYMLFRIKTHQISESVQNTFINAIKFYYESVLGRERTYYDLQRPKKPFQLPNVLSEAEVIKLIQAAENFKHKCILLTIYSAGLRLSEVLKLRLIDIRRDQNHILIKAAKGKKDRCSSLSDKLLFYLDPYIQQYQPTYWLFEGQSGGQYSARSVQLIMEKAVKKSQVNPLATVHTLRHSFATHLVLKGITLRHVQELLGHESSKTTEIYTHLTGEQLRLVKSPLDGLNF
jgi:integrase/recombinase XerD